MSNAQILTTERLRLEPFAPAHADALFAMNSDPDVMRFLGGVQTREQTEEGIAKVQARWATLGYGWWAVFLKDTDTIIGAACLQNLAHKDDAPLEIGWRLMTQYHGKGYATEAGQAAMDFGFNQIGVPYICAVAIPENAASQRVMKRLGMRYVNIQVHYDEICAYYEIAKPD
ncbi:N-acetyltransferase [Loktanella sp. D2R18]|uniref:GNAT family N-acetyltransferase n=1 Tax=Rhodobacterales TaxID=204455 RepID=UPI000DEB49ED|nr:MULTISPECIES: GNAT family N-acetyltransferase [Rhodobacterales]MDO6589104.1 GNAT family N-acetyltransferase [Yoonia sp. 1_MG-2023]RBW45459.1 N-acetyltransferase [Loktanella sp. D2R18]